MTTKEISQQIVSSLIGEIPIEYRDGRDQKEIEEEMEAIVADGIERIRKKMVEKACKAYCKAMCESSENENPSCKSSCGGLINFRKELEI